MQRPIYAQEDPTCDPDEGSFMFVIHAEADGISEKKVKLRSKDSAWVKNNAIVVPCDGLYLIYAHVSSNRTPLMEIKKKEDSDSDSDTDSWLLPKTKEYSPLITSMLRVNNTIRMLLDLSNDELKDDNSYLGIALLQIHQDINSCQQIIQKSCKYEKHRDGLCLSTPTSGKYIGQ
ncbi:uncharacterized protein [Scyliorhinus torazame]|uniref:uncharacterized protein isoform X2 n=1 Tax=Scyliorhinus torazame TaxID=75743 RepID=UPI003B5A4AFB